MNQYGSDVRCLTECSMIYFDCLKYILKLPLFGKAVMKRMVHHGIVGRPSEEWYLISVKK